MSDDHTVVVDGCICEMATHWTTPCIVDGCDYVIGADPTQGAVIGNPIGHDWTEWEDSKNTTDACDCEWIPVLVRECNNCDCSKCTQTKEKDGATAKGHSFGAWELKVAPTATTEGYAERVCGNACHTCNKADADPCFETLVLPAIDTTAGYEYKVITDADCTTAGIAIWKYTVKETDGTVSVIEIGAAPLAALGHTLSTEYTINDSLTKVTIKCAVCGEYVQYNLPALTSGEYTITSEGECDNRLDTYTYTVKAQGNDNGEVEITFTIEVSDPHTYMDATDRPAKEDCIRTVDEATGNVYYVYRCEVCGKWIVAYFE
jgi:hypothetical protein